MPNDSHQRAAEFHELAAHAHRAAAVRHGKEDHQTGHEHSKQAMVARSSSEVREVDRQAIAMRLLIL